MRNIVVGVDGRERSYRALAFSAGLARREHAALAVCYVRPYVSWTSLLLASLPMIPPVPWDMPAIEAETYAAIAREVSAEAADAFDINGVDGEVFIRTGGIVRELAQLADERRADVVVIGNPRRLRSRSASSIWRLTHGFRHGLFITP